MAGDARGHALAPEADQCDKGCAHHLAFFLGQLARMRAYDRKGDWSIVLKRLKRPEASTRIHMLCGRRPGAAWSAAESFVSAPLSESTPPFSEPSVLYRKTHAGQIGKDPVAPTTCARGTGGGATGSYRACFRGARGQAGTLEKGYDDHRAHTAPNRCWQPSERRECLQPRKARE
jgi:hypothetical protein